MITQHSYENPIIILGRAGTTKGLQEATRQHGKLQTQVVKTGENGEYQTLL